MTKTPPLNFSMFRNPGNIEKMFEVQLIARPTGEEVFDKNVVGIEYTSSPSPSLNLDPQHGYLAGVNIEAESAIDLATKIPLSLIPYPPVFVTVRPDTDSLGAMAIILLRMLDKPYNRDLVEMISQADSRGRHVLEDEHDQLVFSYLSKLAFDRNTQPKDKVLKFMRILTGEEEIPEEELEKIKLEEAKVLANSHYRLVSDNIVFVESTEYGALGLGYKFAPVVIALNPAMKSYADPNVTYKKYTIATSSQEYIPMFSELLQELRELEPGWGGNLKSGIIGSPQGKDSILSPAKVIEIVKKHVDK